MLQGLIEAKSRRFFVGGFILVVGGATAILLMTGRDLLMAVGLDHIAAGAIATVLTVIVAIVGLAYFAVYVIDW